MPTLYLKCRDCGEEFPTPIGVTEQGLHGVMISGMTHKCPHCGKENQYFTQDYHIPSATADRPESRSDVAVKTEANEQRAVSQVEMVKVAGYGVGRES